MGTWKKVITEADDANYKNENLTLAQLDTALDGASGYAAGKILKVNSSGNAIEWASDSVANSLGGLNDVTNSLGTSNTGAIPFGQGDGNFTTAIPSGDVTAAANGALTIGSDKVTYEKMQDVSADNKLLGAVTAGTVVETQVQTAMIADQACTLAKLPHQATATFLGRTSPSDGDPEVLTKTQALAILNVENGADVTDTANVVSALNADFGGDVTFGNQSNDNTTFTGHVTVSGNLTVSGTTTSVDTTNLEVKDKNILLGSASHVDDSGAETTNDGAGISVQTDSGTDATSQGRYANLTWNKTSQLTGWKVEDTQEPGAFDIAIMEFSSDSSAPSGDAGGVGSFHFDSGNDTLYIRTA